MKKKIDNFMKYRYLLKELVKKGIVLKYRRSALGILWTLLEPILTTLVLTLVFGTLFGNTDPQFPVYILTGRLVYSFFSQGTKGALRSIRSNSGMIKKVYVPKYLYPLSSVLFNYIIFAISLIVLLGAQIVFKVKPTWHLIGVIIPLLLLLLLTYGIGMILAAAAVFFRDLEYLWDVALMLIMYTCAIFYKADKIIVNANKSIAAGNHVFMYKSIIKIFDANPLYGIIKCFRDCVFYATEGTPMDIGNIVTIMIWCIVTLVIGNYVFYKNQDKFILYI